MQHCRLTLWVDNRWGIMTYWPLTFFDDHLNYCRVREQKNNLVGFIVDIFAPGDIIADWITRLIKDERIKIITFIPAETQPGSAGGQPGEG